MFQGKKGKIIISIIAAMFLIVSIIVVIINKPNKDDLKTNSAASIVGTWYSNKPDSVSFDKDGNYQFNSWNDGNPWLTNGSYVVNGTTITLTGSLDGSITLEITTVDNNLIIVGKYNYYFTEDEANAQLEQNEQQAAIDEANLVPETINKLLGAWTSLDETTDCTFTETSFTVHYKGSESIPEDSLYYEYNVISESQIAITENGSTNNYNYSLYEKEGVLYLNSPIKAYAATYYKGTAKNTEDNSSAAPGTVEDPTVTDTVISSVENPDVSDYVGEQAAAVDASLIGTWKGTFDDMPNANSSYWIYTFSASGTYSFSNAELKETGTYKTTHEPNNNYYHSTLHLTTADTTKDIQFYFSGSNPIHMTTDDQTDPTYIKQ